MKAIDSLTHAISILKEEVGSNEAAAKVMLSFTIGYIAGSMKLENIKDEHLRPIADDFVNQLIELNKSIVIQ